MTRNLNYFFSKITHIWNYFQNHWSVSGVDNQGCLNSVTLLLLSVKQHCLTVSFIFLCLHA